MVVVRDEELFAKAEVSLKPFDLLRQHCHPDIHLIRCMSACQQIVDWFGFSGSKLCSFYPSCGDFKVVTDSFSHYFVHDSLNGEHFLSRIDDSGSVGMPKKVHPVVANSLLPASSFLVAREAAKEIQKSDASGSLEIGFER